MESLLQLLPEMIRQSGNNPEVREQAAFAAWKAATNYQLAKTCVPLSFSEGLLVVGTRDKVWKAQLEKEASGWVYKLNSVIGMSLVNYIEFRVDRQAVTSAQPVSESSASEEEEAEIREYLAPAADRISDPALRETFLRAASRSLTHNKHK